MIIIGVFAAAVILGGVAHLGVFAWILAALVTGIYYRHDVKRNPRVPCRVCHGNGANDSKLGGIGWFRRPFGDCWCCGGRKSHPRFALRLIDSGQHRVIRDEISKGRGRIGR